MAELNPLTRKQQEIYDFISRRIETRGYPPTIRDIGTAFEIRSPNGVMCHLKALEKKGYITRQGREVSKHRRLEERAIPEEFDFRTIRALSHEGREKLARIRPRSLGQAARIPGVTPADVSILLVWLDAQRRRESAVVGA